ncbi:MAG: hypothetical protein Q9218_002667 [Villophora microphyllina]
MSRLPNGHDGYLNGDHVPDNVGAYHTPYRDDGSAATEREARVGGYGGFRADDNDHLNPVSNGRGLPAQSDDHHRYASDSHGYSRYRIADRNQGERQLGSRGAERDGIQTSSNSYGSGPGGRQIEEHHQGFNSSIGTFHKIQSSIQSSQMRVRSLKDSVYNAKSSLMEVKPELQGLGASSQRYSSMLHILNQIEKLKAVPEQLDARIADKQFLTAIELLQNALRVIRKSEMESIGALSDLRVYFSNQETLNDGTPADVQQDSFRYIHVLLEALNRLGCLDVAVDRIEQRLPVELFTIVERTNQEVDLRHPTHRRDNGRLEPMILDYGVNNDGDRSAVLEDLLWILYSKFEAIAEGHRVFHDVVMGIARRNGVRHPERLGGSFKELWKLYQSERIFQMTEVDQKAGTFTAEQEELDKILQNSVPGLANKSQRRSGVQRSKDRVSKDGPATHRLLVESSVFNIGVLLPPSLAFLQRLKDIVPPNSDIAISTLTTFLDDFLVNVFLPQLEESVTELCAQSYMDRDAFQEDPHWQQWAPRPILKVFFAQKLSRTGRLSYTEHSYFPESDKNLLQVA